MNPNILKTGRLERFDPKSRNYPITSTINQKGLRSYTWRCNVKLDQGPDGACVGFAWAHELAARPKEMLGVDYHRAMFYYHMAQLNDPWNGGAYLPKDNESFYEGSSVLGGAKALHKAGVIEEYRWCFSLHDVLMALSWNGPVVVGTKWLEGMFYPDAKGYVKPSGANVGGHAYLLNKIDLKNETIGFVNSWGSSWAKNGEAKIKFADFETLLLNRGEACAPIDYYIR